MLFLIAINVCVHASAKINWPITVVEMTLYFSKLFPLTLNTTDPGIQVQGLVYHNMEVLNVCLVNIFLSFSPCLRPCSSTTRGPLTVVTRAHLEDEMDGWTGHVACMKG